jgi:tRNA nucleotidyltransferase (CCA-adding enzyme)
MNIDWKQFTNPMVQSGFALMREVNEAGFEAYIVGGAVRDAVMGADSIHDIDIATNMPIDVIKENYRVIEYGGGEAHGTVIVRFQGQDYELTQFRTDGTYSDNRRPDSVKFVQSFFEDTKRRDFTINSMGMDYEGNVVDYHGGIPDIKAGIIRTVGSATDRFAEDALRMVRAIRFACKYEFTLHDEVIGAITMKGSQVSSVSVERIVDEMDKILDYGSDVFAHAVDLFNATGLWDDLFPELRLSHFSKRIESRSQSRLADANGSKVLTWAILVLNLNGYEIDAFLARLKLPTDLVKGIAFTLDFGLDDMSYSDIPGTLKIVNSKYFEDMRALYRLVDKETVTDEYVEGFRKFNAVMAQSPLMSKALLAYIKPSEEFGDELANVREWAFAVFRRSEKVVNENEIKQYVDLTYGE